MNLLEWKYHVKGAYKRCGAEYNSKVEEILLKKIYIN